MNAEESRQRLLETARQALIESVERSSREADAAVRRVLSALAARRSYRGRPEEAQAELDAAESALVALRAIVAAQVGTVAIPALMHLDELVTQQTHTNRLLASLVMQGEVARAQFEAARAKSEGGIN